MKAKRIYDQDFKETAVKLSMQRADVGVLAIELGISKKLLYSWRSQYRNKVSIRQTTSCIHHFPPLLLYQKKAMKKTRRTEREGFSMITRYLSSGMSVDQFIQKENISLAGFYLWKKRYSVSVESTTGQQQLYPISVTGTPADLIGGLRVTYPNGVQLRLDSAVSIPDLRQLIRLFR